MKKVAFILAIIAVIGVGILFYFQFNKTEKLVYIDTNELMEKYTGMVEASEEVEKNNAVMQANVDTLMADLEREIKLYEKERKSMSVKEIELKEELLRNKQYQLMQYQEATKRKMEEEESVKLQTVINKVNEYITNYGKINDYKIILGANGSGNLLYADEGYNITNEIIEGLNAEYKKSQ